MRGVNGLPLVSPHALCSVLNLPFVKKKEMYFGVPRDWLAFLTFGRHFHFCLFADPVKCAKYKYLGSEVICKLIRPWQVCCILMHY